MSFGKGCQRTAAGTGRHGLEEHLEIEPFPSSLAEDLNSLRSDPKPQLLGQPQRSEGYFPSICWKSCCERKPNIWSSGILWAYMQTQVASPSFRLCSKLLILLVLFGAGRGGRTPTRLPSADFESAEADAATI